METVFLVCAVIGGVIMLCQFLLSLLGIGGDHEIAGDHHLDFGGHGADGGHGAHGDQTDHGSTWFFNVLSLRAIVAALAFFGISGLAASASHTFSVLALPISLMTGLVAMVAVAWIMGLMHSLQSEGNVHIEQAVGALGTVYLSIPPHGQGSGKVTIKMQNRTMEYQAVTPEIQTLETGAPVVVLAVVGPDTVEVGPAPE